VPSAVQASPSAVQPPVDVPAAAPASAPIGAAQADGAASKATALPVDDAEARQRKADEDVRKKAEAELKAKAKAEIELQRKADLEAKAKADGDGKPPSDADAKAKAKADAKADADAAAAAKPVKSDPKAEAAEAFRKGYEAYLSGRVPEGIRMMEKADSMGAQGARARLCAIYRKPTAAEGKDFLKEANKCKGVD
jgi:membrane protein involved in colicin uptake